MRRGAIGSVLLIMIWVCSAWGHTALDLGIGSEVFPGSARCLGMGEVSVLCEDSPRSVVTNPALLGRLGRPALSASYRLVSANEDWSLPVHDSFDALLGYEVYSHNWNTYHDGDVALASGRLEMLGGASFGFAYLPAYDFRYDFYEEVRDRSTTSVPADEIIAKGYVKGGGVIRSASLGVGKTWMERLSVGASLDYLWGDYDIRTRLNEIDTLKVPCWNRVVEETTDVFTASNLSGVRYRFGMAFVLNERVDVGAGFTSRAELEGDYESNSTNGLMWFLPRRDGPNGSFKMKYPEAYWLGVTFRPRNQLLTVIEGNVRYVKWSEAANEALDGLTLKDVYEWSLGIEHVFYNNRPLRFGFTYRPSPTEDETSEAVMTVGSAITVSGFDIDFAVRTGWERYRKFSMFDDATFCARERDFSDRVSDMVVGGMVSISRRF
jgi:hypothetical protein